MLKCAIDFISHSFGMLICSCGTDYCELSCPVEQHCVENVLVVKSYLYILTW